MIRQRLRSAGRISHRQRWLSGRPVIRRKGLLDVGASILNEGIRLEKDPLVRVKVPSLPSLNRIRNIKRIPMCRRLLDTVRIANIEFRHQRGVAVRVHIGPLCRTLRPGISGKHIAGYRQFFPFAQNVPHFHNRTLNPAGILHRTQVQAGEFHQGTGDSIEFPI